jgi:patatin-like phospholipase/acyl hydrolase
VRASTAAPVYFPPEVILVPGSGATKEKEFVFVDGGVTMYNNPVFQMFHPMRLSIPFANEDRARGRCKSPVPIVN